MTVNGSESVQLIGNTLIDGSIESRVAATGINVPAETSISTRSFADGNAGDLIIDTKRFTVANGSTVVAQNFGFGIITASESVEVTGRTPDGRFPSNLSAGAFAEGNAGDVVIETNQITVKDGAEISVSGLGMESAGNLQIQADSLNLDRGILSAETTTGDRGNITLNLNNLQLRNQSAITTNASGTANGGNISLSSDTIAALENSDIVANAVSGDGGNIAINTQGLFVSPNSNISASSEFGISGTITINNPAVDPASGLIKLSENLRNSTEQIGTGCAADQGNSFIVTGRGGLPEDPTAIIRGTTVWRDLRDLSLVNNDNPKLSSDILSLPRVHPQTPTVEANRWIINHRGQIELVAELPDSSSPNWYSPLNCQAMH